MSVILRPEFPRQGETRETLRDIFAPGFGPRHIPIRGASTSDIAITANSVDLIFNLAISALQGQLENLRENLPVSNLNNFKDIYNTMCDLRSETLGRLEE